MTSNIIKSNSDLALLLENILDLVDTAKNDVLELDKIIKTTTGDGPGILIELERIRGQLHEIEAKLGVIELASIKNAVGLTDVVKTKHCGDVHVSIDKRLKKLERALWMATGIIGLIGFLATVGNSLIDLLRGILG